MKKIIIKNRYTGNIIISGKYESIKDCIEKNPDADLTGADLRDADLTGADLRYAALIGAALRYAALTDADLRDADLIGANLRYAALRYADLTGADLTGADLTGAALTGADLRGADFTDADLTSAALRDADLTGAKGLNYDKCTLRDYINKYKIKKDGNYIFAYKGVTNNLESPTYEKKIKYEIGKKITVDEANPDYYQHCGAGINLCPNIEEARRDGSKILLVKVNMLDIVVIPHEDNKFRVMACEVIEEIKEKKWNKGN